MTVTVWCHHPQAQETGESPKRIKSNSFSSSISSRYRYSGNASSGKEGMYNIITHNFKSPKSYFVLPEFSYLQFFLFFSWEFQSTYFASPALAILLWNSLTNQSLGNAKKYLLFTGLTIIRVIFCDVAMICYSASFRICSFFLLFLVKVLTVNTPSSHFTRFLVSSNGGILYNSGIYFIYWWYLVILLTWNSFTTLQLNDKGEAVAVGKLFREKIAII